MEHRIKLVVFLILLAGLIAFLISIGDLLRIVIAASLLSFILDPLVTSIEARGLSRLLAVGILYLFTLTSLCLVGFLSMPLLSKEMAHISDGIDPQKVQLVVVRLQNSLEDLLRPLGIRNFNLDLMGTVFDKILEYSNTLLDNLLSVVTLFTNLVLIPFIVFFLLKDGRAIKKYLIALVPNRYFELTCNWLYKMDIQLGNYLRGQILDALIIGILSAGAMWILGVEFALLIGIFAGLANMVPYIGPLAGALLAIFISLVETGDLSSLWPIASAFAIIQLLDNVLIQPTVIAKNVDLPPLAVLLVVIIGGKFFGILGMILSVPITSMLKVSLQEGIRIYRQYRLS